MPELLKADSEWQSASVHAAAMPARFGYHPLYELDALVRVKANDNNCSHAYGDFLRETIYEGIYRQECQRCGHLDDVRVGP